MPVYALIVRRRVNEQTTGDDLIDWSIVMGKSLVDRYDIGHKLVYAIENKKHVEAFLSELDAEFGDPIDIFNALFEFYTAAGIFTAISNNLVNAFRKIDLDNDVFGFYQSVFAAQYFANSVLSRMKQPDVNASIWIYASHSSRYVVIIYVVGEPTLFSSGYGSILYGVEPWGSRSGNYSPLGYGYTPYGIYAWG